MTVVAVEGAAGYVGAQAADAVLANGGNRLVRVLRGHSVDDAFAQADIVIHAANPARRFHAEQQPLEDFVATVEKTACFAHAARGKRFVLISSLSCRTQLHSGYGRHRRACELLALAQGALVIRLGPMFGGARKQDSLHDILAGRPVFVAAETRYAYVDVAWVGRKIVDMLAEPPGIRELGARNSVRLGELRDRFSSPSTFSGGDDTQVIDGFPEGPDAEDVYAFAERELKSRGPGGWR
jgi:uncharacterized protein YbjT (DUF2867 family)